jgi:hypothetical protein
LLPIKGQAVMTDGRISSMGYTEEIKPFLAPAHFWEVPASYKKVDSALSVIGTAGGADAFVKEFIDDQSPAK